MRSNHIIEFSGKKQTITEWAEEMKIDKRTLRSRIVRGWNIEQAMTVDPAGNATARTFKGTGNRRQFPTKRSVSPEQAQAIRDRYAQGDLSYGALAKLHGMTRSTVTCIVNRTGAYQ